MPEPLTFYFDPMCPYAYQTSLWIREVRRRRDLAVTWRFFSLEEVNLVAGKRHPWERPWSYGFGQMRVGALIRRDLGNDALDRWYAAVGKAFFFDGLKTHVPEVHAGVIADAGFDASFVDRAVADESTLDRSPRGARRTRSPATARTECRRSCSSTDTRSTVRSWCPRPPATTRSRSGSSSARCNVSRSCTSCVIPKTMDDLTNVARHFRTYLTTRDWQTVENPAP